MSSNAVLNELVGVQRVVLKEFAFVLAQDRYVKQILGKDPKAPIAYRGRVRLFVKFQDLEGK